MKGLLSRLAWWGGLVLLASGRVGCAAGIVDYDGWTLTFEDDFDALDENVWTPADNFTHSSYYFVPGMPYPTELQLYTRDSAFVENGSLVLETAYRPDVAASYGANGRNFTSGWVDSMATSVDALTQQRVGRSKSSSGDLSAGEAAYSASAGFSQTYGRFEIRAKLPPGASFPSIWPALWMMPLPSATRPPNLCWPAGGEIDILEMWGNMNDNQMTSTMHWTPNGGASPSQCGNGYDRSRGHVGVYPDVAHGAAPIDFSQNFHEFALEWNETSLTFYVDDKVIGETHTGDGTGILVPSTPFYFIFNTAICGGSWCNDPSKYGPIPSGAGTTVRFYIDRVRAYAISD